MESRAFPHFNWKNNGDQKQQCHALAWIIWIIWKKYIFFHSSGNKQTGRWMSASEKMSTREIQLLRNRMRKLINSPTRWNIFGFYTRWEIERDWAYSMKLNIEVSGKLIPTHSPQSNFVDSNSHWKRPGFFINGIKE